jgi:ketosteroid isomerase-like protein
LNIVTVALMCLIIITQLAYSQDPTKTKAASLGGHDEIISQLRAAYAAFNRGDFNAAVAALDPKIEWTEPLEFPGGGTYHGREAVEKYLMQSRAGWAEGSSEPERFITAGDRIVVFVHARFRPKESTEWQEVKLADVYSVRKRKIVQMRAFADRQEALSWDTSSESRFIFSMTRYCPKLS